MRYVHFTEKNPKDPHWLFIFVVLGAELKANQLEN